MDTRILKAVKEENLELLKNLISDKANVNATDCNQDTTLTWAAFTGNMECMKLLIKEKADIHHKNFENQNAIFEATRWNHYDCLALLIEEKGDVNVENRTGETALIKAALHGYTRCAKLLITASAEINHQTHNKVTPLSCAIRSCITVLLSAGAILGTNQEDKPFSLFKKLSVTDLRATIILKLMNQLMKNHERTFTPEELKTTQEHMCVRKNVHDQFIQLVYQTFDMSMGLTMPIELLNLILEYQPLHKIHYKDISFFSPENTHLFLDNEPTFNTTRNSLCK